MAFRLFVPGQTRLSLAPMFVVAVAAVFAVGGSQQQLSNKGLDELIQSKNYLDFEQGLRSASLSTNDRLYFEGILADRLNQPSKAISLLERALPELVAANQKRAATALNALAEDYFLVGRYSESTARYGELLRHFHSLLDRSERQTVQDNHDTVALFGNAPAQTISGEGSFSVRTRKDQVGDLDVPLQIRGDSEWWLFDTGANISTVTTSTAERLGLTVSKGHAQTKGGATGAEVLLSTAIVPKIRFGRTIIRNVAVLVMDDKELRIDLGPQGSYQITGILGYPVLAAMQRFTVTRDELQIGSALGPTSYRRSFVPR